MSTIFAISLGRRLRLATGLAVALVWPAVTWSKALEVVNGSFEAPATDFVEINIDAWQKTPKPDDYDESGGFFWSQLTGVFRNAAPEDPRHIVNCDGDQAIWLFAVLGAGLVHESSVVTTGEAGGPGSQRAVFEPGKAYRLTVGVLGGGGGMLPGASLELGLFYRGAASNRVNVAVTTVAHEPDLFGADRELLDFTVAVPEVKDSDPWADQLIGISLLSTAGPDLEGGYWELDNVRLEELSAPRLVEVTLVGQELGFVLESEAGLPFEVLASADLSAPMEQWISVGYGTNLSGGMRLSAEVTDDNRRFYRVRQLP